MKKATIIHHQGFGDIFTSNALCNHYSNKYEELIILAMDNNRKIIIDNMYKHIKNIKCVVPSFHSNYNGIDSCLICMTPGNQNYCPRVSNRKCQYIDYSDYKEYDNIKVGCFSGDYQKWDNFLKSNYQKSISFSHSFYLYHDIDLGFRTNGFSINKENINKNIPIDEYIVIHDDSNRGLYINKNKISGNIYQLNDSSIYMIDQISILENAKEIHFIDSSYSVMIYFLSFFSDKIANMPKYLHEYVTPNRDTLIYTNPVPPNWNIIK